MYICKRREEGRRPCISVEEEQKERKDVRKPRMKEEMC